MGFSHMETLGGLDKRSLGGKVGQWRGNESIQWQYTFPSSVLLFGIRYTEDGMVEIIYCSPMFYRWCS